MPTIFITEYSIKAGVGGMSYHLTRAESDAFLDSIKSAYGDKATITRHGVELDDLIADWLENYNGEFGDAPDLYIEGKH